MKNKLLIGLIIILILVAYMVIKNNENNISTQPIPTSQTNSEKEVAIEVVPKVLASGKEAIFQVSLNTHSVPLDYDLINIVKLTDDRGNIYQALSWDGGKGGHHLDGALSFPKILKGAKSINLTISQIGAVERNFRWSL